METVDLTFVDELIERLGPKPEAVIPMLQGIQEHYRYLPREALERVCTQTEITPAAIAGVSTFYDLFRHKPVGKHLISVCHGTACHVKSAGLVQDALFRALGITGDQDTDAEGIFTVQKVACLGCCTLAPVVQIDHVTYGHLTPDGVKRMLHDFLEMEKAAGRGGKKQRRIGGSAGGEAEIRIGLGSCCVARGSAGVYEALQRALTETGVQAVVKRVGCVGMCHQTPLVEVVIPGQSPHLYAQVKPADAKAIILRHFKPRGVLRKLGSTVAGALDHVLTDETWASVGRYGIEPRDKPVAAFLGRQKHLATEHCGHIDPTDLDEYERHDGFTALRKVLGGMEPERVIEQVLQSGLRGRGGAGFPTGTKWAIVASHAADLTYIVCNGDEGDPGAFMDRMLLESYPYRVLEGFIIAAYAVGAAQGRFYIRAEYPLAVARMTEALDRARAKGYLGQNILGSKFSLDVGIMQGAGAFVCGEETALLASIEGRRGMPRFRPPFPAEKGLWDKPTLVNNVETYALVPWIMRHGWADFFALGTEKSKGTKVFALAGKIARGGLIEVPMGVTVDQIVQEIGGGIAGGKRFKAVQVGGPSGGCVPAELGHTPVDYEALTAVGAIMGSGGLVVLDEDDCMVDIARYFLEFTQNQSCGKCTFCRIGTRRMLDIMERLCGGLGRKGDLEELEALAHMVRKGSLCGLGRTAPNPILSTLKFFRDEYQAHLEKRCPAGRCKALIKYVITDDCIGCTICAQRCPSYAITPRPHEKHEVDMSKCVRCDTCRTVCPVHAVKVE
jgi:NADH-quinone oxidoreductase subunit F